MPRSRVIDQHIAVFGESGSGKTVLLSSFYGGEQEPDVIKRKTFHLVAEDAGQGTRLHQNYLGMKDSAALPDANRFSSTTYRFALRFKGRSEGKALKNDSFDAVRLVWHDYPGEWFEQDVSGPEEARRRTETFASLLDSHVAMVLIDGQKLLDNAGEEERYLKSVLGNFRSSLLRLEDELVGDSGGLVTFPRIWVITLTKADLLPDLDVQAFKEMMIGKVGGEINELRDVLARFVDSESALSVGEDFLVTSSAQFTPGAIDLRHRIGVDLVAPIAALLPFERHVRWMQRDQVSRKVASDLLGGAEMLLSTFGSLGSVVAALAGRKSKVAIALSILLNRLLPTIEEGMKNAKSTLDSSTAASATKRENLAVALAQFHDDLARAERESVLVRSQR